MIMKFLRWYKAQLDAVPERLEAARKQQDEVARKYSKVKCPKCDSKNLKVLKPSLFQRAYETQLPGVVGGYRKRTRNLNVCRDCGFSWENR